MGTDRLERLASERADGWTADGAASRVERLRSYREAGTTAPGTDVAALRALGSDTRYAIARLLVAADEPLCVCEIDTVVDVSSSAVSHALSTLHDAGLVHRRKEGTWRYYGTTARAEALLDALDATRGGA